MQCRDEQEREGEGSRGSGGALSGLSALDSDNHGGKGWEGWVTGWVVSKWRLWDLLRDVRTALAEVVTFTGS